MWTSWWRQKIFRGRPQDVILPSGFKPGTWLFGTSWRKIIKPLWLYQSKFIFTKSWNSESQGLLGLVMRTFIWLTSTITRDQARVIIKIWGNIKDICVLICLNKCAKNKIFPRKLFFSKTGKYKWQQRDLNPQPLSS